MAAVEASGGNLGGSIPVPSVKVLAANVASNAHSQVPERYIRPEMASQQLCEIIGEKVPVIDLSRLLNRQFSEDESLKLHYACEEWGFFQLINHGIPDAVIQGITNDIEGFFELPLEVKNVYAQPPNSLEGYGQTFVVSEEQKLDWADVLLLVTQPFIIRNHKLWPSQPPTFSTSLDTYSRGVKKVVDSLMRAMSRNLGLDEGVLSGLFKNCLQTMRMNYYPPCPVADKVIGLSQHSDSMALTVLLQLSDVQGLQIEKNGGWFPIDPLPGALVVNIGDALEVITNGRYKSIQHRAVVDKEKERISVAAFNNPSLDVPIGPLPQLVGKAAGGKARYKTLDQKSYLQLRILNKLDGKSVINHMKLDV